MERHPARRRGVDRRLERRRDVPDHHELRLAGPRPRRQADRAGPAGRAAGPHGRPLPRRPSGHGLGVVRGRAARADPPRPARPRVHRRPHRRLRRGRRRRRRHDARLGVGRSRASRRRASSRPPSGGARRRPGCCSTPAGIEQHTKGVDNVLAAINLGLATGKFGKPGCGVSTITGQGNGQGGREHGHKCDQLPGNRDITNPEHRAHVASVWGCDESEIPGKGIPAQEIIEAIHAGRDQGSAVDLLQPGRLGARRQLHRRGPRPARVLRRHRVLPVGVRRPRRHRAARLTARRGRGHVDQR